MVINHYQTKKNYLRKKSSAKIAGSIFRLILLGAIFSSCKNNIQKEPELPQVKMIKSIKTTDGQLGQILYSIMVWTDKCLMLAQLISGLAIPIVT